MEHNTLTHVGPGRLDGVSLLPFFAAPSRTSLPGAASTHDKACELTPRTGLSLSGAVTMSNSQSET